MTLRWEKLTDTGSVGLAGEVHMALVGQVTATGMWYWDLKGVTRIHGLRSHGERKYEQGAKKSAEAAWAKWCALAGVAPAEG